MPDEFDRSWATAMDASGLNLAGQLRQSDGSYRAAHCRNWMTTGWQLVDLPAAASWSNAVDVSSIGVIAGNWQEADGSLHGYWWWLAGTETLEGPNGSRSWIWDSSPMGNVFVGVVPVLNDLFGFVPGLPHRACVWAFGGGPTILTPLPGAERADARATSEWGSVIVGTSYVVGDGYRATVWTSVGPIDLTDYVDCLGYRESTGILSIAIAVSDDGSSILAQRSDGRMFLVTGFSASLFDSTDINRDGATDGTDLSFLIGAWGTSGQGLYDTDIDNDGLVEGKDLAYLLSGWAPCP
jgi:hypothetical protein